MVEGEDLDIFEWSRYSNIHEFAMKPVHALINIVGAKPSVRTELKNIIQEGLVSVIHKPQTSSNFHYAKPLYNI